VTVFSYNLLLLLLLLLLIIIIIIVIMDSEGLHVVPVP